MEINVGDISSSLIGSWICVLNVSNGILRTAPRMRKVLSMRESARECLSFFFFYSSLFMTLILKTSFDLRAYVSWTLKQIIFLFLNFFFTFLFYFIYFFVEYELGS